MTSYIKQIQLQSGEYYGTVGTVEKLEKWYDALSPIEKDKIRADIIIKEIA